MAVRQSSRPFSVLQDENVTALPGKGGSGVGLGLKQTLPTERKKLSNITNKVLQQGAGGGGGKAAGIKPESKPVAVSRPLQKSTVKETQKFPFPKSLKVDLTDEMKQKAHLWAQEGIEKIHFTGNDSEALRKKIEDQEMEKRVATVLSYRTDIPPFLHSSARPPGLKEPWETPDLLKLDPVDDLENDAFSDILNPALKEDMDFSDKAFSYYSIDKQSPPRFPQEWLHILDEQNVF